jgi:DNA mismatch repair protein MutL
VLDALSQGARARGAQIDTAPAVVPRVSEGGPLAWDAPWPPEPVAAAGDVPAALLQEPLLATVPQVLGQHRLTYVVASDGDQLLLVDQHTAHERVRFEQILDRLQGGDAAAQMLLVPIVCDVPPRLRPLLEAHAPLLRSIGYDVEEFGGASLRIAAVPALLPAGDHGAALMAVLADLADREEAGWAVREPLEKLAATVACHSAVRAGQALGREPMVRLVADLLKARHPGLCPHGRPTMVRVPQDEVTRWFGRTGWRRQ